MQDTVWHLRTINEWHRLVQGVDRRPFLRNTLERKAYEAHMEAEILVLEASGYRVFLCENGNEYRALRGGGGGEGGAA